MHIPENYLSPSTCAVMYAAAAPAWALSVKKVKDTITKSKMPLLGICAAFSFLGMMFNVPLPGGTTGHAVGGTLIAILLGPEAACISVTIALLVQALLFGDGGILAFGANCFNMAFVLPYVGYGIYKLLRKKLKSQSGEYISAAIGSYIGINAAALCAAVEFGLQPLLFKDAAGQALYCPYPLSVSIPAMAIGHLTLFGLAEIIFTVAILAFVRKAAPTNQLNGAAVTETPKVSNNKALFILLGVLIVATPLGLLASGTAWGEWGSDEIAEIVSGGSVLGYTPKGMSDGFELSVLCPDYAIGNMPEWLGYILSAVIGVAIVTICFKVVSMMMKDKVDYSDK